MSQRYSELAGAKGRGLRSLPAIDLRRRIQCLGLFLGIVTALLPITIHAGGGPDRTVLLIDPDSAESRYIGNLYARERGIPDFNIIYTE